MTGEFSVAVHALVYLNHMQKPLTSELLAENVCTHPARIRKVLAKLKKAGLIETREGAEGGSAFPHPAQEVTLAAVLAALHEPVVRMNWHSGDPEKNCLVASGMADVMDDICRQLDESCKEKLSTITIYDIDRTIFGKKKAGNEHERI